MIEKNNNIQATSATSPSSNKTGTWVEIPKLDTIPIIFIPGIMGSNLRNKTNKKPVWRIGNYAGAAKTVYDQSQKLPAQLQRELDAEETEVDPTGDLYVDPRAKITSEEAKKRLWGTVHWESYGPTLMFFEGALANVRLEATEKSWLESRRAYQLVTQDDKYTPDWLSLLSSNEKQRWHPQTGFESIDKTDIEKLKKFNFPVYALGYNWLQSNALSADDLVKTMKSIKTKYGKNFHKFIVITHSMGGLVGRSLSTKMGEDIAGIIHGVMPSVGAPAVYRRLVAGSIEGSGVKDVLAGLVLGKNTEHVTAVLSNSQGGLELLPSKDYRIIKKDKTTTPFWLSLRGTDEKGTLHVVNLPKADPYKEIYKAHNVWWEMVKDELINPLDRKYSKQTPRKNFEFLIEGVQDFHESIATHYHPHTYVHFGADPKNLTYGTLHWSLDRPLTGLNQSQLQTLPRVNGQEIENKNNQVLAQMKQIKDKKERKEYFDKNFIPNNGFRYIRLASGKYGKFTISNKNLYGDGTVPFFSGVAPISPTKHNGIKQVFQMEGFDHQGSYGDLHVRRSVLYSIVKIIKDNNIQPRNR